MLDLCCGKGGDLLKWQRGRIKKLVCAGEYVYKFALFNQCVKLYEGLVSG